MKKKGETDPDSVSPQESTQYIQVGSHLTPISNPQLRAHSQLHTRPPNLKSCIIKVIGLVR